MLKKVSIIAIMRKSIFKLFACMVAVWMFSTQNMSAQMVAVRTDAVKDLLMTPNVGVDLVVGEKFTLGGEVAFNRNPWFFEGLRVTSVTPEFRYWFNGRPLTRQYVGVVGNMTAYGIRREDQLHQGDAFGIGLSFGHVWTLTQRWNIDFTGSLGVIGYKGWYDKSKNDAVGVNARGYALLPIRLGVSVVYVIR